MPTKRDLLYNPVEENVGPGSVAEIVNTPIYQQVRVARESRQADGPGHKTITNPCDSLCCQDGKERLQRQSVWRKPANSMRPARFVYSLAQRKGL